MIKLKYINQARNQKVLEEMNRGTGRLLVYPYPVSIEPPFVPFKHGNVNDVDIALNPQIERPYIRNRIIRFFASLFPYEAKFVPEQAPELETACVQRILPSLEEEVTPYMAGQFLLSFQNLRFPASFEILGDAEKIAIQMHCAGEDQTLIKSQLSVCYPKSSLTQGGDLMLDYFEEDETLACAYAYEYVLKDTHFLPIRTFPTFKTDPLTNVMGALSELSGNNFGGIQILIYPARQNWSYNITTASHHWFDYSKPPFSDTPNLHKQVEMKISKPLFAVVIRAFGSTPQIAARFDGFFSQFQNQDNSLTRDDSAEFYPAKDALVGSIICRYSHCFGMLLNADELAGLVHLPSREAIPLKLLSARYKTTPMPLSVRSSEGILLGENIHQGEKIPVKLPDETRNRHMYVVGRSGTGKSTLLSNMIIQDMKRGAGLALIDPHGDLVEGLLGQVPPERFEDVIYLNPTDREFPPALNFLEAGTPDENEKLVEDLLRIFQGLFEDSWGHRLAHILRYSFTTLLEIGGSTLMDVKLLLSNPEQQERILQRVKNPDILNFWQYELPGMPRNSVDPIMNKLSPFLLSPLFRNIVCQRRNKVDFFKAMNEEKIIFCNLSKGALSENVAHLFGAFLVAKFQVAAIHRHKIPMEKRKNFYLYVDEFQNLMSGDFDKILSEARKYRLNLILAHQFTSQLNERVRSSIFGNAGTFVSFNLGIQDARLMESLFGSFAKQDILNLGVGEAVISVGKSQDSFNLNTFPPIQERSAETAQRIIEFSRKKYATSREEVESSLLRAVPKADVVDFKAKKKTEPRGLEQDGPDSFKEFYE